MNKIRVEISPDTNYVYHMLAVAGCGYDNDYGRKWRHTLPKEDIDVLKRHEKELTAKGGEHFGAWYGQLVFEPAQGNMPADEYYRSVTDPAMAEVCQVMAKHYRFYIEHVFPESLREMQPYADAVQRLLDESDLAQRAEALVGGSLACFRVMLCNSLAGGAEAFDISADQDVFGMGRTPREEMLFIGHEYIIYLLKQVLEGTAAFQTWETWSLTEGLAQFYLCQLYSNISFFRTLEKEIRFYQAQPAGLTPQERFLRASAWELLRVIAGEYQTILGKNLAGVYAHGSLTMDCFTWAGGDIDFLVVVNSAPDDSQKQQMLELLLQLDAFAPAKGFEMSVVLAKDCAAPVHPIPFCLHYSNAHREVCRKDPAAYISWMKGTDPDLAAHFTVTRERGVAICGKPVDEVFGPVPRAAYLESILADVGSAVEDVRENPVYVILNLCRVLAVVREGAVLSKREGGAWALQQLDAEHHSVVRAALEAYEKGGSCTVDGTAFARKMLDIIKEEATWNR